MLPFVHITNYEDIVNANIDISKYDINILAENINNITNIDILTNILLLIYHYYNLHDNRNDTYFEQVYKKYKLVYNGQCDTLKSPRFNLNDLPVNLQHTIYKYIKLITI